MASGTGGAPASAGTQDTRVARIEEGIAGLQTETASHSLYDANWPTYALTPASLTTSLTGSNNDLVFTAQGYYGGLIGNSISVTYVDPGAANQSLSVSISGYAITVSLATDSGSAITSTAAEVAAAVNEASLPAQGAGGYIGGSKGIQKLVSVTNAGGNNGTGVVTAMAKTSLTGGTAATFNTFDAGIAAGVEPGRAVAQVDTQWENSGLDPWASVKAADPSKW